MAKNTGNGHRQGVVSNRTQTYNAKTGQYVKRDAETGKFVGCKETPYKNIRREDGAKMVSKEIQKREEKIEDGKKN